MPAPHQSTPAAPGTGSNEPVDIRASIYQTLIGKGLTPQQALGVLYSMAGESGGGFDLNSVGDSGKSIGFGQWNGERRANLEATASKLGVPWNSASAQLAHFQNEINGPYAQQIEDVKKATGTADAARIWTGGYERPAVNNWQQRLGTGAQAMSLDANNNLVFKSGPVPSTAGVGAPATAGATATPAAPATSGAQDFSEAAKRGDVGGALAALNKGDDKSKGLLGNLGDQMTQNRPMAQGTQMLGSQGGDAQAGQAQAGQALMGQLMAQTAQPLSWSTRPFGSNAGPQAYGTTLNSWGY